MNALGKRLEFLGRLENEGLAFNLKYVRHDTLMVIVYVPGQHWEVECFEDGHVEVEEYQSRAGVEGEESLDELFDIHGEYA
jgi:hypothetical protein